MTATMVRPLVTHVTCPCKRSMPACGVDVTETMPGRFVARADMHCQEHGNVTEVTRIVRTRYGSEVLSSDFLIQGSFHVRK